MSFHGGAREVGRSCFTLESKGFSLMLDCGLKIRDDDPYPEMPDHTDALIISHAHLDHSGMAPALHKRSNAKIYATPMTLEIAHLLQEDSAKINRLKKEREIYSSRDISSMMYSEKKTPYGQKRDIGGDISFELLDAGHIPGSSQVLIEAEGKRILYTGDIKTSDTRLQSAAKVPEADILITESTYGNRTHPSREEMEKEFIAAVEETLDRGGNAVIPSFAVGRTQEVLLILEDLSYPIYLDGMGQKVTSIFLQYSEYLKDAKKLQKVANNAEWIENNSHRRRAMAEPSAIITTAGMLNGGPVFRYLHRLHLDPMSSILLTGYQVEGTNGRLLMDEGYVTDSFTGEDLQVKMEKHQFDFSAHAGRHSLEKMIKKVGPEEAFVVHGDEPAAESLAEYISGICPVHVPGIGESFQV